MNARTHRVRLLPALTALLLTAGCAGMGWEEALGGLAGMGTGQVRGEVDRVDARDREIRVRTSSGRAATLRYDGRTRVVSGQRGYSVGDLQRGDRVSVAVERDRYGALYAERVHLEARGGSGRDRRDAGAVRVGSRARFEGRAGRVDARNGRFEIADPRRGTVVVLLPSDPGRDTRDRFRRLRRGDHVAVEVQVTGERRARLLRFVR